MVNTGKLTGKIIITGLIELKTGLHIGTSQETLEIGGMDNPVIRDPLTREPYIPGSSLKGKLRSLRKEPSLLPRRIMTSTASLTNP